MEGNISEILINLENLTEEIVKINKYKKDFLRKIKETDLTQEQINLIQNYQKEEPENVSEYLNRINNFLCDLKILSNHKENIDIRIPSNIKVALYHHLKKKEVNLDIQREYNCINCPKKRDCCLSQKEKCPYLNEISISKKCTCLKGQAYKYCSTCIFIEFSQFYDNTIQENKKTKHIQKTCIFKCPICNLYICPFELSTFYDQNHIETKKLKTEFQKLEDKDPLWNNLDSFLIEKKNRDTLEENYEIKL